MLKNLISILNILSKSKGFVGNLISMLIVAGAGAYFGIQYVHAKNVEIKKEVTQNAVQIKALNEAKQKTATALQVIGVNLTNMSNAMKAVQTSIENSNREKIQIYRDLLKLKHSGG